MRTMMSKLLTSHGSLLARSSYLVRFNLKSSATIFLSSNFEAATRRSIHRCPTLMNEKTFGTDEKPSQKRNVMRQRIKYLILLYCGLHFTFWGFGKISKYLSQNKSKDQEKEDEKEDNEYYVCPHSKEKSRLIKCKGVWLPHDMIGKRTWNDIQTFRIKPDDVFVVSYPKSGTTWVQEIVYLLHNKERLSEANKESLGDEFPYLEFPYPGMDVIEKKQSPRLIKTHLPFEIIPDSVNSSKPKIIYVARNVKDVMVSYFHFHRMMTQVSYSGTFSDFLESFVVGKVSYGSWWNHVKSFWDKRNEDNIHFVKYEDLHKDPNEEIKKIAKFLNIPVDKSTVDRINAYCNFSKMKDNPATNNAWMKDYGLVTKNSDPDLKFMRKGQIGDWKNYFSAELVNIVDEKTNKELGSSGLVFCDNK